MHGNLISNQELCRMVESRIISIKPFESERAQLAHYPLDPDVFFIREYDEIRKEYKWVPVHSFSKQQTPFIFEPGQYVQVEVRQHVSPGEGIVGLFVPSSNLINQGLSLTAGKISFPFGQKNERIFFGLKNNLSTQATISPGDLVAYIQFFDLMDSERVPYALSDRDLSIYNKRREMANDDGVWALQNDDSPV